jgi:uncharacterized protein (DUF305 family)
MSKAVTVAAAGLVLFSAAAFAQMAPMDHSIHGSAMPANEPASTKGYKDAHMKMMDAMNVTYSGNADVDFVRAMIPHHQGAIDMAKVELANGKDPELRKLAETIISDQEKEIAAMQAWLKKNAR